MPDNCNPNVNEIIFSVAVNCNFVADVSRRTELATDVSDTPALVSSLLFFDRMMDVEFSDCLGLANARHKNHNQWKKWAWFCARIAPKYLGFPFNISAMATLSS